LGTPRTPDINGRKIDKGAIAKAKIIGKD